MLNIKKLFGMQYVLDQKIVREKEITHDRFEIISTALLVELGECANEKRSFKDWSNKEESEREIILEEYVDGIHFVLSLGLLEGMNTRHDMELIVDFINEVCGGVEKTDNKGLITKEFLDTYCDVVDYIRGEAPYCALIASYVHLGLRLGFEPKEIENAYFEKNKENHERQARGY